MTQGEIHMEYTTLHNGAKMPMLGYGTIGQEGGQIIENVAFALHNGYIIQKPHYIPAHFLV